MTELERDHILLNGTLAEQRAMFIESAGFVPSCDEVVMRAVNKAITALPSMPEHRRVQARLWLQAHKSEAWG